MTVGEKVIFWQLENTTVSIYLWNRLKKQFEQETSIIMQVSESRCWFVSCIVYLICASRFTSMHRCAILHRCESRCWLVSWKAAPRFTSLRYLHRCESRCRFCIDVNPMLTQKLRFCIPIHIEIGASTDAEFRCVRSFAYTPPLSLVLYVTL